MNELATVSAESVGDASVVRIDGEVDMSNADDIEHQIRTSAEGTHLVVLDLAEVSFFDSSGIRMLFGIRQELQGKGIQIAVVAPEGSRVSHILDVARVDDAAPVFRSPASALAAMGAG
jgi:anti-anti-sigma factor